MQKFAVTFTAEVTVTIEAKDDLEAWELVSHASSQELLLWDRKPRIQYCADRGVQSVKQLGLDASADSGYDDRHQFCNRTGKIHAPGDCDPFEPPAGWTPR